MIAILLAGLAIGLTNGQLNYEGNPLTEYTEYTAEESGLSERTAREGGTSYLAPALTQKLYPVLASSRVSDEHLQTAGHRSYDAQQLQQLQQTPVVEQNSPINSAEIALNTFLNSRTPEESRASLDRYLRSQQQAPQADRSPAIGQDDRGLGPLDEQSLLPSADQQTHLTPQASPGQSSHLTMLPADQTAAVRQQLSLPSAGQSYGYAAGQPSVAAAQAAIRTPAGVLAPTGMLQPVLPPVGLQTRNDVIAPTMWRQRLRRVRGKPFPFAQARLAPGLYKGPPIAVPFKPQAPVEVIYTKPPGFHRGAQPMIGSHQYEDASGWFPETDHPPPSSRDIYYSQLYAQSYDPRYYNYIAATGRIRPHLYGKLGKRKEEQDDGIWSELYRGFTKHGLKNIMTPTFLLSMTLPVVTLMLSALIQKRSIARSDARELDQEDALREYLERLRRAMECYADAKLDGC